MDPIKNVLVRTSLVGLMGVVLAACAGPSAVDSVTSPPSLESTPAPSSTIVESTTTTTEVTTTTGPTDAVPAELAGSWTTRPDDPNADRICLSLGANNYSHSVCGDPNSLGGTTSFTADTVTFTSSMMGCPGGIGTYRWELDGDSLTLTQLDPADECDIRGAQLDGQTFTR